MSMFQISSVKTRDTFFMKHFDNQTIGFLLET